MTMVLGSSNSRGQGSLFVHRTHLDITHQSPRPYAKMSSFRSDLLQEEMACVPNVGNPQLQMVVLAGQLRRKAENEMALSHRLGSAKAEIAGLTKQLGSNKAEIAGLTKQLHLEVCMPCVGCALVHTQ